MTVDSTTLLNFAKSLGNIGRDQVIEKCKEQFGDNFDDAAIDILDQNAPPRQGNGVNPNVSWGDYGGDDFAGLARGIGGGAKAFAGLFRGGSSGETSVIGDAGKGIGRFFGGIGKGIANGAHSVGNFFANAAKGVGGFFHKLFGG